MSKAIFNWSGGKDSALALYETMKSGESEIGCLFTSVSEEHRRISMHGVREKLLHQQAEAIGLPLQVMDIPAAASMKSYDETMRAALTPLVAEGYTHSIFGDIFLEDLRKYREEKLGEVGLQGVFPLWKRDTKKLVREFLALGFKTITVCVNAKFLDESFVGRVIDEDFLNDLPDNVDPCGEYGEFHTFVFDGPIFKSPIPIEIGEKVHRNYEVADKEADDDCPGSSQEERTWDTGFWYCDLLPAK
jgi:uncharacterized protein (TIGR00290 family)